MIQMTQSRSIFLLDSRAMPAEICLRILDKKFALGATFPFLALGFVVLIVSRKLFLHIMMPGLC